MEKIRILFDIYTSEFVSGAQRNILYQCKYLKDKYELFLITPSPTLFSKLVEKEGIKVFYIERKCKLDLFYLRSLYSIIKKNRIHILCLYTTRLDAMIAKIAGVKVIERLNMTRKLPFFFWYKIPIIDEITARWIDMFVCVSKTIKEEFQERYPPQKLMVIPNGVDINMFRKLSGDPSKYWKENYNLDYKYPFVGTACRLVEQKGIVYFIKAAKLLEKEKITFVIGGEGPLHTKLKEIVKRNDLKNVRFLGYIHNMPEFLSYLDIFVLPSLWEPMANTVLEVLASGTPLIATNVDGTKELLDGKDVAFLIPPSDPNAIVEGILKILNDERYKNNIVENGKRLAKEMDISRIIGEFSNLYEKLL